MDPISHLAFGRTIAALDSHRMLGPGTVAACVIGAVTPDVDAVLMPFGWDIYLRLHQGGTHSLIGSLICAAMTAAALRLHWTRVRYLTLWLAASAGTSSHLLLDAISGADIQLFWPWGRTVSLPLFAMADPWLGGVLVFGLVMLLTRRRQSARAGMAILMTVAILAGVKAVLYNRTRAVHGTTAGDVEFRRADAEWGALTTWTTYETRADTVEAYRVDATSGAVTPLVRLSRGLDVPVVVRSRELASVRHMAAAHGVTFATVTEADGNQQEILWSDLRYCGAAGSTKGSWPPWAPTPAGGSPVSCALWFGGNFDVASQTFRATIVRVGSYVQRRSLR
ncbi:MAG: metal-dependent hydrolase [Vicinamibacterales bacterium]